MQQLNAKSAGSPADGRRCGSRCCRSRNCRRRDSEFVFSSATSHSGWHRRARICREFAVWADVHERRDEHRRIDDDTQRRSAFLFASIWLEETRLCVACFLLRTCCNQAPTDGRAAKRSSAARKNSCIDLPCKAARAASSSRTSQTSRILI